MALKEIDDPKRYDSLGKLLDKTLRSRAIHSERRKIGFPGNSEVQLVHFLKDHAGNHMWYAHWRESNRDKVVTLLGHGTPKESDSLNIDVQFNYPVQSFHRKMGGVFLEDVETGAVMLAHRGILTLKTRVPADDVLEAMAADVVEAETAKGADEFILAAALDSPTLVDDLSVFSAHLRQSLRDFADARKAAPGKTKPGAKSVPPVGGEAADPLRNYFEEFSGKRRSFKPKKVYPVSHHGKVVHALHEIMVLRGPTLKSRAVDLVADLDDVAVLFEVKTSADTQSIYTAVGQLFVHAPGVIKHLGKPIKRVLVIPERPMNMLDEIVANELGIRIITYVISAKGVVKVNIEDL